MDELLNQITIFMDELLNQITIFMDELLNQITIFMDEFRYLLVYSNKVKIADWQKQLLSGPQTMPFESKISTS